MIITVYGYPHISLLDKIKLLGDLNINDLKNDLKNDLIQEVEKVAQGLTQGLTQSLTQGLELGLSKFDHLTTLNVTELNIAIAKINRLIKN